MGANPPLPFALELELVHQLSTGEFVFPTFPDVVFRIRAALMDQRCSAEKLCRIVSSEPVLTAHVLKTANFTAFNPGGRPITELPLAVRRLGFFMVRNIAYAVGYKQLMLKHLSPDVLADLKKLWHRSLEVGCCAYVVGARAEINPDEAFLAGLMHNVGNCYVRYAAGRKPELYRNGALVEALIAKWGSRVANAILLSWGIAEETRIAIANLDDPGIPLPAAPMDFILRAALTLGADEQDVAAMNRLEEMFLHLGIPAMDASYLREQAECELDAILAALG